MISAIPTQRDLDFLVVQVLVVFVSFVVFVGFFVDGFRFLVICLVWIMRNEVL